MTEKILHDPQTTHELIPAAVLIPLILPEAGRPADGGDLVRLRTRAGELLLPLDTEILLTVRTHTVEHHKGQISFPGGAFEPGDSSLEQTALRETHEEVGLPPEQIEIVAELPEVPTVATRFTIRPFVGIIRQRPRFQPNPDEIGEILIVTLRHLLDPAHSLFEDFERNGLKFKMKTFYYDHHRIWGATGLMLQILLEKFVSPS